MADVKDYAGRLDSKRRSAIEVAQMLRPDDVVAVPIVTGQPRAFLRALGERTDWRELTIFAGLFVEPFQVLMQPGVRVVSGFFGPVERMLRQAGARIEYLPADFLGWERFARRLRPRVICSALSPMDADGFLSFGLHAGATYNVFMEVARDPERLAIGEVVRSLPRVFGLDRFGGNRVHVDDLDVAIDSDEAPIELPPTPPSLEERRMAAAVAGLIESGATIQIGIGGVPNAIAAALGEMGKGDFGIHTEMMVDGIMDLHQAGAVTNRKGVYDGFSVATFAAGSRRLYDWMHENETVRLLPVTQVNEPSIIRRNRRMISINGALAVDLAGQVMADAIGGRQYSGVGGQEEFVIGARESEGGKSFVCLKSTANVGGVPRSTIVPDLGGGYVTTPRHHTQYVVTEYGAADLTMLTDRQRSDALIAIAHPDFRGELRRAAAALA